MGINILLRNIEDRTAALGAFQIDRFFLGTIKCNRHSFPLKCATYLTVELAKLRVWFIVIVVSRGRWKAEGAAKGIYKHSSNLPPPGDWTQWGGDVFMHRTSGLMRRLGTIDPLVLCPHTEWDRFLMVVSDLYRTYIVKSAFSQLCDTLNEVHVAL